LPKHRLEPSSYTGSADMRFLNHSASSRTTNPPSRSPLILSPLSLTHRSCGRLTVVRPRRTEGEELFDWIFIFASVYPGSWIG
jgi:hypothetical protein